MLQNLLHRVKLEDAILAGVIGGLIIIAFALGRISALPHMPEAVSIDDKQGTELFVSTEEAGQEGGFVASKNGTKYHLIECPGAKQIKEENKIYFSSEDEARNAGYAPAVNCPELIP